MKPTVAVALSGGVDSLTAAWLLKAKGYPLIGVHFITGFEDDGAGQRLPGRLPVSAVDASYRTLMPIADRLDIPLKIYDARRRFRTEVVDYFMAAYRNGQTPNPCMICNPVIKFGDFLQFARAQGADRLATGHYARVLPAADGRVRLFRGIDPAKDQSYFLARISRRQLRRVLFPLGEMVKTDVIALARAENLTPTTAGESQDICFIRNSEYGAFMARQPGFVPRPGPIVTVDGVEIGRHPGLHLFTIGQRRGINCPARAPYYVVRIEPEANRLVVGPREALGAAVCRVADINWIADPPTVPTPVTVKIRYRHPAVAATLLPRPGRTAQIRFDAPQTAVTPGQGAVFYRGEEVLGGGWITAGRPAD